MDRRAYLRGAAAVGVMGAAGCLGLGSSNPNVTLPEPDRQYESADVPYPAWGEAIPDVTVPAPLDDRDVGFDDVDRPQLVTFFYSHCQTVCPVLVSTMRRVQTHAIDNDYGDEVRFFPITFDPERDTADRLEAYAEKMNVDADHGNWQFLRPASKARAEEVVTEEFGVAFERTHPEEMEMYMFAHQDLTLLANADGYVERTYRTDTSSAQAMIDDLRTLREA